MSLGFEDGLEGNRISFEQMFEEFKADCRQNKDKATLKAMSKRLLEMGPGVAIPEKGPYHGRGENDVRREIVDGIIAAMP